MKFNLDDVKNNSEIIFDANTLEYRQIISFMEQKKREEFLTYKIWPQNSKFLLGSDDLNGKGEIIKFD